MFFYYLECPSCGVLRETSKFNAFQKTVKCLNCGRDIGVKENKLTSRRCTHCGSTFIYNHSKKHNKCPVCGKELGLDDGKLAAFPCPQCSCVIQVDKNLKTASCPVCGCGINDVAAEIQKTKLVSTGAVSVIKFEGDAETLVWKHPIQDFNFGSQLIVHESQEALLLLNGRMLPAFTAGEHLLETEMFTEKKDKFIDPMRTGTNPFHSEVYFINKTVQLALNWGTDEKVNVIDPETGIPFKIGVYGKIGISVSDSARLISRLVGTTSGISWESRGETENSLKKYFKPQIVSTVRSNLSMLFKMLRADLLDPDAFIGELSSLLREKLIPVFDEYGLYVPSFFIEGITLPEDDPNFRSLRMLRAESLRIKEKAYEKNLVDAERDVVASRRETDVTNEIYNLKISQLRAQAEADSRMIKGSANIDLKKQMGLAEAEVMAAKGYNQRDVISGDVQKTYAESLGKIGSGGSSAAGSVISDAMGIGVGFAAAGEIGRQLTDTMRGFGADRIAPAAPAATAAAGTWDCACGNKGITGKFCSECGAKKPEAWDCPNCGAKGVTGKFCSECGYKRQEAWDCPSCGAKGIKGRFCSECGYKKD